MTRLAVAIATSAALLLTLAQVVVAAPPPITNLLLSADYEVNADGTYARVTHFERRAASDAAAQRIAQFPFGYSPSLERLEVAEAFTRKADGRVLPVPSAGIRDQLPAGDPSLHRFTDGRQKVILFPQVAAGDTVVMTVRQVVSRPRLKGVFSSAHYFVPSEAWDSVTITIKAPASLPLQFEAVGAPVEQADDAGTITYRWHLAAPDASPADIGSIAPIDRSPRLVVTSAPSWEAIAHAYAEIADPKSEVTPAIQALADEITTGVDDRRQQAKQLYDWVAQHIRYIAVYLGNGAIEPHAADTVLSNGYGDCKDQVVLLTALLKAKGIASEPVLISLASTYQLPVPAPFARLNHAIVYLPEFQLYADTTSVVAPFGTLPFGEYGKPVIHAVPEGPVLRQIPMPGAGTATTSLTTSARLTDDGRIIGDSTTEATGPFATSLRYEVRRIEGMGGEAGVAQVLRDIGEDGTGHLDLPDAGRLPDVVSVTGHFDIDAGPHWSGDDILSVPSGLRLLVRPGDLLLGRMNQQGLPETEPTPCYPGRQAEVLTLTLPPDRHPARLPAGRTIVRPEFEYRSQWSLDGQTITVRRELLSRIDQPLCSGALRQQAARALAEIRRDYADRVILDRP
jgi:transglutaminase-like putative cysteine protease